MCFQHETCMICCKYNSLSDSSTKFTRFGVSSYTCNSDFAVADLLNELMNSSFWIDAINLEWSIE